MQNKLGSIQCKPFLFTKESRDKAHRRTTTIEKFPDSMQKTYVSTAKVISDADKNRFFKKIMNHYIFQREEVKKFCKTHRCQKTKKRVRDFNLNIFVVKSPVRVSLHPARSVQLAILHISISRTTH